MSNLRSDYQYKIGDMVIDNKRNMEIIKQLYIKIGKDKYYTKSYLCKCNNCGYEQITITEYSLNRKRGCPICCSAPKIVVQGINDIPTTAPWMIPYFQGGYNEAKLYTQTSNKTIYPVCQSCGMVHDKPIKINNIYNNKGFGCICNSSKISYSEKFIYSLLNQLDTVKFTYQLTKVNKAWCKKYKYDFYVNNQCIIETHGIQHYVESFVNISKDTLIDIQNNDKQKEHLAKDNGIEHYIVLDCRKSELEWIKKSVMESELPTLFNFTEDDIDWLKCEEVALSNLVKSICEFKSINPMFSTVKIANIFGLNYNTVARFLKCGCKYGWCVYDVEFEKEQRHLSAANTCKKKFSKPIAIYKNDKIIDTFNSLADLCRASEQRYGIQLHNTLVGKACKTGKVYNGYTFIYL